MSVTPLSRDRLRSPSPILRGSHHSGREVVVEHVVEKASAAIVYPVLTRTNYTEWSLVMQVNLQVAALWEVISKVVGDYHEDRNTLAVLLRVVPTRSRRLMWRRFPGSSTPLRSSPVSVSRSLRCTSLVWQISSDN
jgi:hypothetical protein